MEEEKKEHAKQLVILPKFYAKVCEEMPPEHSDYTKTYEVAYGSIERYEIIRKIGRGKYSEVYEGINSDNDQKVAIKILKPGNKKLVNISKVRKDKERNKSITNIKEWTKYLAVT